MVVQSSSNGQGQGSNEWHYGLDEGMSISHMRMFNTKMMIEKLLLFPLNLQVFTFLSHSVEILLVFSFFLHPHHLVVILAW